jgi:N-methylhydantoinase A
MSGEHMPKSGPSYRIGVDIGGTFTDIVLLGSDGTVVTQKISSSVDDYARAIIDGLSGMLGASGIAAGAVAEIRHGTTVASNAILERKGARVGLITTKGFRDILEIRNLRMPRLYDMSWSKPPPLVERYLRQTVDERVDHRGRVERALGAADAERAIAALLAEKVSAIAVCLLNSFANPAHELMLRDRIKAVAPALPLSVSCEVLPEIKEYERTSTTVINAYVMPIVATYLAALRKGLDAAGIATPLLLMQSNGGLTTDRAAAERPMNIIESGPAGGVVAAQALARAVGEAKIITFDMGGTTAKASIVEDGQVTRAHEYAVGAGIMIGSRLLTGAGYTLKVPAIDLAEVGAGGGSHVTVDAAGALQVGPESSGASPGPVCYDAGGTVPTITDASVILGLLNPQHLVGGALRLDADQARRVFAGKIAEPLGLDVAAAALGAHQIAQSNMIRAIRAVSTERGRDPRDFALVAFGGNGPLFACGMAQALGIRRVIVPPAPGLFSALGLLHAELAYHYARSLRRRLRQADPAEIDAAFRALAAEAAARLAEDGISGARASIQRFSALHYKGQSFELVVPVPEGTFDRRMAAALEEAFGREHEKTYGHRAGPDEPVELVAIQVIARGLAEDGGVPQRLVHARPAVRAPSRRRVYFGAPHGWMETPIIARAELAGPCSGPLIIEEYDATALVPPGATASRDAHDNIIVALG